MDLTKIEANVGPRQFCLTAMSLIFSEQEMAGGGRYWPVGPKPGFPVLPLIDEVKVAQIEGNNYFIIIIYMIIMFLVSDAVQQKFGNLSKKVWQDIRSSCNQKCRDMKRKVQLSLYLESI